MLDDKIACLECGKPLPPPNKFCSDACKAEFVAAFEMEDVIAEPESNEFDNALMNCHQLPSGHCMAAGSEHCDFDCPFRADGDKKIAQRNKLKTEVKPQ